MNRIYKVIWSKVKHQYVVVSELAHSCTKSAGSRVGRSAAAVLAALVLTTGLCAAPVQAETPTDTASWEIEVNNDRVEKTKHNSFDPLYTPSAPNNIMPLANEDEEQPGEGGDTTPTEPTEQHTIYNEEGFYAHNGNSTYNALTKDGLWVGGDDQNVGFHVDNEGNLFTNGTATFKQGADMGGQKITNVADGEAGNDAVNVSQLTGVENRILTNTPGAGISVVNDADGKTSTISVQLKEGEQNLVVNEDGLSLSSTLQGLTSVDATGAISGGSVSADGSADGVTIDNGKITGLTGMITDGTDAANKNYVDTEIGKIDTTPYVEGNGIAIADPDGAAPAISVKLKEGEKNLAVGTEGLSLKPEITLDKVTSDNFTVDGTNISLTTDGLKIDENTSLTNTGLTTLQGKFSASVIVGSGNTPVTISDGKIINLTGEINGDYDAANKKYVDDTVGSLDDLAVKYNKEKTEIVLENLDGVTIRNLKAGNWEPNSSYAATVGQVYEKAGSVTWRNTNFLTNDIKNLTDAVIELDTAIGDLHFDGDNILAENATKDNYKTVTDAIEVLDRGIGDLNFEGENVLHTKQSSVTDAIDVLNRAIGPMAMSSTNFLQNQTNLSGAVQVLDSSLTNALQAVGVRTYETVGEDGKKQLNVSTTIEWGDNFKYIDSGSIVSGISVLDNQLYKISTAIGDTSINNLGQIQWANSTYIGSGSSIIKGMENLDKAISELDTRVDKLEGTNNVSSQSEKVGNTAVTDSTVSSAESTLTETTTTEAPTAATMESAVAKAPAATNSMLTSTQPMTMALKAPEMSPLSDPPTLETPTGGDTSNIRTDGDMTTVEKDFTVEGDSTFKGSATFEQGADMNGQKITNVGAGTEATDGVNYGQLQAVQNQVDANTQNIGILGSAVNKLGDRIERVGAGAAALAALHPLDFDPDNKLDFAAGFGNYRGASAVAVGAFYRPSENVMFSVGGAFGGGEDMVNAGVSFKVGAGSGSATTSRTAMAKSLKSMQEVVASQDAQLAQQREQIDKLTAMVELLMEQNGQAQPKDGDAQAEQPQQ